MPTYQYLCTECDKPLEVQQRFSDASLTECPSCSGKLRKVFNAVGVVFKGSGFYRTDSRGADPAASSSESSDSASSDSGTKADSGDGKKSDSSGDSGSKSESSGDSGKKSESSGGSTSGSDAKAKATTSA